ncbi:MliC family protein [Rhizobium sp. NRK18]|uniref:MliC family protein n=1 Tax=Rhizobium sp. NRK18 TaxID=2964667 RepID=UPI0021C42C7D|nr:MliC family protein [Rhizobium sp. NRK18]MCQ2003682.1 MliC family protein [Rhizobium sp. NRK18]
MNSLAKTASVAAAGLLTVTCLWPISAPAANAASPSFDCTKASHEIETLICGDGGLAALDRKLQDTFRKAVDVVQKMPNHGSALSEMKAYQRGWIKGRDDCWKADDKRQCTMDAYRNRIAELQARYVLIKGHAPVFYTCNGNPADEVVATFFDTDPQSVRLERGDTTEIALQAISASGARYEGDFGLQFWIKGDEAMVTWPQGNDFTCKVRQQ